MKNSRNKLFLYTGLCLLCIAIILRWQNISSLFWVPVFFIAIVLKAVFLVDLFRTKEFKLTLWLVLIITGVVMILTSMLFKYVFDFPVLRQILFYGAISLKVIGLLIMLIGRIRVAGNKKKTSGL